MQALHLVAGMLRPQPEERRRVQELLRHPWWLRTARAAAVLPRAPCRSALYFREKYDNIALTVNRRESALVNMNGTR